MTYENMVNLDAIEDELVKNSMITQISNYGQTPTQLFKEKHPKRSKKHIFQTPLNWNKNRSKKFFEIQSFEKESFPIIYAKYHGDKVILINSNRELVAYNWLKSKPCVTYQSGTFIGRPFAYDLLSYNNTMLCIQDKLVVSCGHFDKSIKISSITDKLKVIQSLHSHKDIVTCLTRTTDNRYIISGSKDCTVNIWEVNPKNLSHPLGVKPNITLFGHENEITSITVNKDLDIVASSDINGNCILHSLIHGNFSYKKRNFYQKDKTPIKEHDIINTNIQQQSINIILQSG
jgi:neurobeachin-like protein 1/2